MALVEVKDYTGDLIAKTVMEALEMIGIVNKLNINGYHLSILGITGDIPVGMADDTPSKHIITIDRNKFIRNCNKRDFKKVESDIGEIETILNDQDIFNVDFEDTDDRVVTHEISQDSMNYMWYKHMVQWEASRSVLENEKGYIERIFKNIADYVIETFESMMVDEGEQ